MACPADNNPWFARLYDICMAPVELLGFRRARAQIVGDASGLVLEVGAGTGLNLPHYREARRVIATDPEPEMLGRARRRSKTADCHVSLVLADAQVLPFRDATFDTVVATCVFCTVPDPAAGFRELHRVLKPAGELRLLEHLRAPTPALARLQDFATPAWKRAASGCHLNRPTLETARRAGFTIVEAQASFRGVLVRARLRPAVEF
jgi:ubiquinone/menaquinone biosynthesis C-methylase UbiE